MAINVVSTPPDLPKLNTQQRIEPVGYKYWPASPGLDGSAGELAEPPTRRRSAARGALLGILLGTAFYGVVPILLGVIKL